MGHPPRPSTRRGTAGFRVHHRQFLLKYQQPSLGKETTMKKALAIGVIGFSLIAFGMLRVDAASNVPVKLGYVDLQKTLNETKTGQKAKGKLEAEKKDKQSQVDKKKNDFQRKIEDLDKQRVVLKPDA